MVIRETLETPVAKQCDVLVCGGGIAGISAALAAAREGSKVILLEKEYALGGLGTLGLVTIYLPLCDGMGHQVSFGIAEELLRLSISMGAEADYPENWLDCADPSGRTRNSPRYQVQYNPALFAILAEQLLQKEQVQILYGTYAVGASMNGPAIDAVIAENKSGRFAIRAGSFVDATGDCDLAKFSGCPAELFRQGNVLAAWYYRYGKDGYRLNPLGACDIPDSEKTGKNGVEQLVSRRFTGLDGDEISQMTVLSHQSILNDIRRKRKQDSTVLPVTMAGIPQIRMTRKIRGAYTLDDSQMHTPFDDSVGMVSDWRKRGPVYEVPFRTLYAPEIPNLIAAGRCTSVTESMWDIMRVIPCCAVTGQAAGTAASLSHDFSKLDVAVLQDHLKRAGVILHEKDL